MAFQAPPRAFLILATAQIALGLAGVFATLALQGTGSIEVTFIRLLIAVPIMLGVAAARGRLVRLDPATTRRLLLAGVVLGLHFVSWIASLQYVSVALSTLLVCTAPFWLALYDALIARRPVSVGYRFGIPLAAVSLVFLIGAAPTGYSLIHGQPLLGCIFALAAALLVGIYLSLIAPLQTKLRTLTVVAYTYSGALMVLLPLALVAHQPLPHTADSWLGIVLLAGFTQLIGHTALSAALRYFSATLVAFICLLEPVIAALAAALFLGQALNWQVIAGGAVLLYAISLILRGEERQAEAAISSTRNL